VRFEPQVRLRHCQSASVAGRLCLSRHGKRMVQAFSHSNPERVASLPLMYQGCPDFLPPKRML